MVDGGWVTCVQQWLTCSGPQWVCCQSYTAPCTSPLPQQQQSVGWNICHEGSSFVSGNASPAESCQTTGVDEIVFYITCMYFVFFYLVSNRQNPLSVAIILIATENLKGEFTISFHFITRPILIAHLLLRSCMRMCVIYSSSVLNYVCCTRIHTCPSSCRGHSITITLQSLSTIICQKSPLVLSMGF